MPRPDEFGIAADLEAERKAVDKQIEEAKRRTKIDLDQVVQQHLVESERLQKATQLIDSFQDIERLLKTGFHDRSARWQVLRRMVSFRIHMRFIENIRKRGFDGRLQFEHDVGEQLWVEVATSNDTGSEREIVYKGPSSLSGGERSFVTVSLLLAMWDAAPSNLRCLDEWDVFLDSANRKIAAGLLVSCPSVTTANAFRWRGLATPRASSLSSSRLST
jgi:chromosome segregation ATPase